MEIAVIKSYNWVVCKKNYLMCAWFELPGESRFIFLMFIWYTQQVVYIYKFENIFPQSVEYRCAIFCNNPLNYQRIEFKFRSIISSDFARIMLIIFILFKNCWDIFTNKKKMHLFDYFLNTTVPSFVSLLVFSKNWHPAALKDIEKYGMD